METIVRHVRDMNTTQRSALEQLVGHNLRENQQLVIQVMTLSGPAEQRAGPDATLPDWCNVYEGLTDEQIAGVERVALQRADLARTSSSAA
ncbi:MAG: hypothetical protein L0Y71_01680 [Gemmataceae bacterium]|nr:hypothetical protein [Gemmataceae bacterium]